ncbi:MAG: hypothetical protein E7626_00260 [Ruminococcaceae bacterium]|nr:hypothetical protein [Oscillospiraceae bacterium]
MDKKQDLREQNENCGEEAKICNMCGKVFDFWDTNENFCFDCYIGYGSSYDLQRLRLNLCCDCFDKVLDWMLPQCKINPMTEYDLHSEFSIEDVDTDV